MNLNADAVEKKKVIDKKLSWDDYESMMRATASEANDSMDQKLFFKMCWTWYVEHIDKVKWTSSGYTFHKVWYAML